MRPTIKYHDTHGQSAEIVVPEGHNKICCNLSGGADSALMAYLVIRYCENYVPDAEIHFITIATPSKGWYHAKWSTKVLDAILKHTSTSLVKSHQVFYKDEQTREIIDNIEIGYISARKATLMFNAVTQNPPAEVEHLLEGRFVLRDPGHPIDTILSRNINGIQVEWHRPFVLSDKRLVAAIYNSEDLGWLYQVTRSCEQYREDNSDDMEGHCGKCWWCRERLWAFDNLLSLR